MIDIGVNLTNARFDKDLPEVLSRAKLSGVKGMLVTGTNIYESQQAIQLCTDYSNNLYATVGVHPHDSASAEENYLSELETLAKSEYVKAIGECGLDFNRNFSPPDKQKIVFEEQIQLAEKLQLPLFLHQRDAFDTWYQLLCPYFNSIPGMVSHCFTGNLSELKKCLDAGMYIGITGWLCDERRGKELQDIVRYIPLERLLIETDAPYLTPRTIRPRPKSSRNEPAYLSYIVTMLSHLLNITEQEIIDQTSLNANKVFNLSGSNV